MKVPFVDLKVQYLSIKDSIDEAIAGIIEQSNFVGGQVVTDFENAFAEYIGAEYCIGCGNCTDALEIILQSLGIGPGDEVIVPACSWISTSECVTTAGAKLVFADVLPELFTIDPNDIINKITPKTKAIIPVHLYGLPAEMDEIMAIAQKHNLYVIEDCAQSHGAEYKGRKTGTFGKASAFSFYPGKNLGAYGDGGAMVTNDPDLAETLRMRANHGQKGKHNHILEGRNSRLDSLQAAILLAKLPHLDTWSKARLENASRYTITLKDTEITLPVIPDYSSHVFHLYVIQVENRERIMKKLKDKGIQVFLHYPTPLPFLEAYQYLHHQPQDFPVASTQMSRILSLPMYPELSEDQINYVCQTLLS
ncbi:DegT/DnrJ/EryC1/StrS family aminotransferase [soil metagenome]